MKKGTGRVRPVPLQGGTVGSNVRFFWHIATFQRLSSNLRFWHKADIRVAVSDVRFWGKADIGSQRFNVCF
jgi:hypothetical protein